MKRKSRKPANVKRRKNKHRSRVGQNDRKLNAKLMALRKHAAQLNFASNVDEIVMYTLDAIEFALGFDFADFLLVEQRCVGIKGTRGMEANISELPLNGRGLVVKAARDKAPIRISDTRRAPEYVDRLGFDWKGKPSMLSELAVPVILHGTALAVLNVESKRLNAFTEEDQKLLETLASYVSSTLSRLQTEERYRSLFDRMLDGMYLSTHEGRFVDVNPAFVKMFGYSSKQEMLDIPDIKQELYFLAGERGSHVLDTGKEEVETYRMRRKDGSEIWVEDHGRYIHDEHGKITYHEGILRDVTERVHAERTLSESEEKYRAIVENSSDMISLVQDGVLKYVNKATSEKTGWTRKEIMSPSFNFLEKFVAPSYRGLIAQNLARRLMGETIPSYEVNAITRDGTEYPVIVHAKRVSYLGKPADAVTISDISERKGMEEALSRRARELDSLQKTLLEITGQHDLTQLLDRIVERAAQLLDAPAGGMYLCDSDKREVRCVVGYNTKTNPVGTVLKYGEGLAGTIAQTKKPLFIDDYRTWSGRATAYEKDQPFTAVLGAPMIWQGHVTGVIHVLHDTKVKQFTEADLELLSLFANHAAIAVENAQAQERLRRRAEEMAALQATVLDITGTLSGLPNLLQSIVERAVRLLDADGGGLDLCDSEKREVRCVVSFKTPRDFRGVVLKYGEGSSGRVAETGKPLIIDEYHKWEGAATVPGAEGVGAEISVPMIWRGQVTGVIQVIAESETRRFTQSDVDLLALFANHAAIAIENERSSENLEQMVAERTAKLTETQNQLQIITDSLPTVISYVDSNQKYTFNNKAYEEWFGQSPNAILGRHVREVLGEQAYERIHGRIEAALSGAPQTFEYEITRRSDTRNISATYIPDFGEHGQVKGVFVLGIDITERKRMEERLLKAERLAAIGETAAMIGHDLRNPLQAISAATYVLKKNLPLAANEQTREMLEAIENSVGYSDRIVADLLQYSQELRLALSETTPKSLVRDALVRVKIPDNITVSDSTSDDSTIRVDATEIGRVFVNLVENAVDAMPTGGELTISSKMSTNEVEVKFIDTGKGIPESVLREIWKPLITTKPKGMGLGLAICKRIVEAHRGSITVDSTVGKGTTFTLRLPTAPNQEGAQQA